MSNPGSNPGSNLGNSQVRNSKNPGNSQLKNPKPVRVKEVPPLDDYSSLTISEKRAYFEHFPTFVPREKSKYRINADYAIWNSDFFSECDREMLVSLFPMMPLLFNDTVALEDADYILYSHQYARVEDMSRIVLKQLQAIDKDRRPDATIIVVGKACNIESLLGGSIKNIIFWDNHYAEKAGQKFGRPDITEQYFVYDPEEEILNIWPVNGCLQQCKFCRRTYMHIPFESLPLEYIKEKLDWYQANEPEKLDFIRLRAENLTEYGIDLYGEQKLAELIDLISSYDEVHYIEVYIGLAIGEITDEILDAMCKSQKFIDVALNLEAGTDRLLKVIGKNHTCERAIYICDRLYESCPSIILRTNMLVGLPTETWEDIEAAAELCLRCHMTVVDCLIYGSTPGQPLAILPQLSPELQWYHSQTLAKRIKEKKLASGDQTPFILTHRKPYRHGSRKAANQKSDEKTWFERYGLLTWWMSHYIYLPQYGKFLPPKKCLNGRTFWHYYFDYHRLCDESPST